MNPKYSNYLFTELILELNNNLEKDEIYHELIDRLIFCGIDYDTACAFIELEKLIVKNRNIKWDIRLYNKYWWLNENLVLKQKEKTIFNNEFNKMFLCINPTFYNYGKIPKTLLSISELICLMDEATYIDIKIKEKGILKNEIDFFKSVSYDSDNKNVEKELYFRLLSSFETTHKSVNYPKNFEKCSKAFYRNELNILFLCKWTYKRKYQYTQKKIWRSYSSEYNVIYGGN